MAPAPCRGVEPVSAFACLCALAACLCALAAAHPPAALAQETDPLRVYVSVDMEGIGGIGVPEMVTSGAKDYEVGRRLATAEVNAVVEGIRAAARAQGRPAEILVNDSHGDMRNVRIEELAEGVSYLQGNVKPFGMVEGLDSSFDAAMFVGYHARAGTEGFLSHTGSGSVLDLRIDGMPAGEADMNAALAGAHGVPVALVAGDSAFVAQVGERLPAVGVVTKTAVTGVSARLRPVGEVLDELRRGAEEALGRLDSMEPWAPEEPVTVEMTFQRPTHADIATGIPTVERSGPRSVRFEAADMPTAYRLIRILYKFLSI